MQQLIERIKRDGVVKPGGVLKVDSFLNHQIDPELSYDMAKEIHRLFADEKVDKILTIEASGIGMAVLTGLVFGCPVLFAKKSKTINLSDDIYSATVYSFTHQVSKQVLVSKRYLNPGERVLIVDDFLANGAALEGLCDIVGQAGAEVVGAAVAIEKAFQPGGERLRGKGLRIEALARIASMSDDSIEFCED
ncbi:MAG: xanthine phosphoribosyltransferase [Oscillospiraceae bacterium]